MTDTIKVIPHSVNRDVERSMVISSVNIEVADIKAAGFVKLEDVMHVIDQVESEHDDDRIYVDALKEKLKAEL